MRDQYQGFTFSDFRSRYDLDDIKHKIDTDLGLVRIISVKQKVSVKVLVMTLTNERYLKLIQWKMFMFSSEINASLSAGMLYVIDTVVTIRVKNISNKLEKYFSSRNGRNNTISKMVLI